MVSVEKLILGTVQLGIKYGINNQSGKPTRDNALYILHKAFGKGIRTLDTADAYGDAIQVIGDSINEGHPFKVITKFIADPDFKVSEEFDRVTYMLGIPCIECWMYHRFEQLQLEDVRKDLINLKISEKIKSIGVSIYTNDQLRSAIEANWIDVIQLPFNLLDNINTRGELLKKAKQNGKEIHARSVFLQGLFFISELPDQLRPLKAYLDVLNDICRRHQISMAALALHYVLANDFIDKALIGVETAEQLEQNLELLQTGVGEKVLKEVNSIIVKEPDLLNPGNWNV